MLFLLNLLANSSKLEIDFFAIDWRETIAHLLATAGIIFVFWFFVRKSLVDWLQRRQKFLINKQKAIDDQLTAALNKDQQALAKLVAVDKSIIELRQEAETTARHQQTEILKKAIREKNDILDSASTQAQKIAAEALIKAQETMADQALGLTKKLLQKNITAIDHQQLINDFINDLDSE